MQTIRKKLGEARKTGNVCSERKSVGEVRLNGSAIKQTVRKGKCLSLRIGVEESEIKMILK